MKNKLKKIEKYVNKEFDTFGDEIIKVTESNDYLYFTCKNWMIKWNIRTWDAKVWTNNCGIWDSDLFMICDIIDKTETIFDIYKEDDEKKK